MKEDPSEEKDCREGGSQSGQALPESLARKVVFLLKTEVFEQYSEGQSKQALK